MPYLMPAEYRWLGILGGIAIGSALILVQMAACGGPTLLQCRIDAAAGLPLEPDQVSLGDVKEVVRKLKACQAGDAGK